MDDTRIVWESAAARVEALASPGKEAAALPGLPRVRGLVRPRMYTPRIVQGRLPGGTSARPFSGNKLKVASAWASATKGMDGGTLALGAGTLAVGAHTAVQSGRAIQRPEALIEREAPASNTYRIGKRLYDEHYPAPPPLWEQG